MKSDKPVEKMCRRDDDHLEKKDVLLKIYTDARGKECKMFDICFMFPHYHVSGGSGSGGCFFSFLKTTFCHQQCSNLCGIFHHINCSLSILPPFFFCKEDVTTIML